MKPEANAPMEQVDATTAKRILRGYEGRERQLWSIAFMILMTVATGFAVLALATVTREAEELTPHLSKMILGFAILIGLLTTYIILQRRALNNTRAALLEQVIRGEQAIAESFIDPLTGLFNRRYLDYFLHYEAKRVDRYGGGFALLMLDVDDFKQINDHHGHPEGDRFLQEVSGVLKGIFRDSDTIMRYGGDEFVILMPDTPEQHLHRVLERVQEGVAAWNQTVRPIEHSMSLSCGAACFARGDAVDTVLAVADRRMYEDKSPAQRSTVGL